MSDSALIATGTNWEARLAELWASFGDYRAQEFSDRIDALASELPAGSAVAMFERASALDSTGQADLAVPLYRQALKAGLEGIRRRRAVIQLASSLRSLGNASESVTLLTEERARGSDELDDAVAAFLALALADVGREREAASIALTALSGHLTRYQRSLANYAGKMAKEGMMKQGDSQRAPVETKCDPAIACSLSPEELRAGSGELLPGLCARAEKVTELSGTTEGIRLQFLPEASLLEELAKVITREQTCCAFLRFQLSVEADGAVTLDVTGPAGTLAVLTSLRGDR